MISIQSADFNLGQEYEALRETSRSPGAIVTFTGLVRDLDRAGTRREILALELEHYPGMTEKSLQAIIDQARERWPLDQVRVIHRVGYLPADAQIVFVGVSSSHRDGAFAAAEFIMDYLKTRAPFWKKQMTPEGEEWVEAKDSDQTAASRWKTDP